MKVRIVTEYLAPQRRLVSEKSIEWHDSSDRKWLNNHLHWAMMNQRSVTLMPGEAQNVVN